MAIVKPRDRGRGYVDPTGRFVSLRGARMDICTRADGRIEQVCKHGVGHPIGHLTQWKNWMGIHGCDGCCGKWAEDRVTCEHVWNTKVDYCLKCKLPGRGIDNIDTGDE